MHCIQSSRNNNKESDNAYEVPHPPIFSVAVSHQDHWDQRHHLHLLLAFIKRIKLNEFLWKDTCKYEKVKDKDEAFGISMEVNPCHCAV